MAVSGIIRVMERAARKAGQRLRRDFGEVEHLQVSRKGPADFVTKADRASERTLYDELLQARPDWGFVLEEAGVIEGDPTMPRWVIDPLDGTSNFIHSLPHFAISIAVQEPRLDGKGWGEISASLVYQPITDESFWAEKNRGAWLNDRRLRVSGRRRMGECVFATGLPFSGQGDLPASLKDLGRILPGCAGVRRWGAASLDMAYVAGGRFDGFWERGLKAWDLAAGILIVREAGGFVEAIDPEEQILESGQVIASNEAMFEPFAKLIRNV